MRIEEVETLLAGDSLYVRLTTDSGITGWGQSAVFGYPDAVQMVVNSYGDLLIGMNPLRRERIWHELFRAQPFRSSFITAAVAAIDISLWDIAGRHFDVPCFELMGGPVRDRIRLHLVLGHGWRDRGVEAAIGDARAAAELGFTAIKFNPFLDEPDGVDRRSWARSIEDAVEFAGAVRKTVGWDIDIAFEFHRRFSAAEAAVAYQALAPLRPYMIEDALSPDSTRVWGSIAGDAPTGTGERLDNIWEFADLLANGTVDIVRPDVGEAGGITHVLKIAAVAEAQGKRLLCHNYVGPLLTLATAHVYASVTNVSTFEYTLLDEQPPRSLLVTSPARRVGGYLELPEGPGLGYGAIDVSSQGPFTRWIPGAPTPTTSDGGLHLR